MKTCTKCNIAKDFESYYKDRTKSDGYRPDCKKCISTYIFDKMHNDKEFKERKKKIAAQYIARVKIKTPRRILDRGNTYRRKRYKEDAEYRKRVINNVWNYRKESFKKDPAKRALYNARSRIHNFLKRKTNSFSLKVGCTRDEFKAYIESQFQPGMSWENYGLKTWHIDHKYPISLAYKEGKESLIKACYYTNLQPMWAIDNIKKSNKIK